MPAWIWGNVVEEHWDFYLFDDQGAVSSNFLNMSLAQDAPVASHSVLGLVEITMLTPRPDGLSSDSEADALNELEDAIVNALVASGAINCGRTTGRGVRTLAFYAASSPAFEKAARTATRAFPAYACEIETKSDPDWDYYLDFLFPSPEEWERMKNQKVLRALIENGDQLDRPREIDHWVFFDDQDAADAFASGLASEGFTLRGTPAPLEDGGPISVQFWREDAPREIDGITQALSEQARALGGDYDGWECPIIRKDDR
jgi:hypothetical protein